MYFLIDFNNNRNPRTNRKSFLMPPEDYFSYKYDDLASIIFYTNFVDS